MRVVSTSSSSTTNIFEGFSDNKILQEGIAYIKKIQKSIEIIRNSAPDYEFKTTFTPDLLTKEDIVSIAKWLEGSKRYYLQQFKNDALLISSKLQNIASYSKEELIETLNDIKPYFKNCEVRGI